MQVQKLTRKQVRRFQKVWSKITNRSREFQKQREALCRQILDAIGTETLEAWREEFMTKFDDLVLDDPLYNDLFAYLVSGQGGKSDHDAREMLWQACLWFMFEKVEKVGIPDDPNLEVRAEKLGLNIKSTVAYHTQFGDGREDEEGESDGFTRITGRLCFYSGRGEERANPTVVTFSERYISRPFYQYVGVTSKRHVVKPSRPDRTKPYEVWRAKKILQTIAGDRSVVIKDRAAVYQETTVGDLLDRLNEQDDNHEWVVRAGDCFGLVMNIQNCNLSRKRSVPKVFITIDPLDETD